MPDDRASRTPAAAPLAVVVMGVAGCGKSVLGAALAERLGGRFVEGDLLHPPQNVALMAAGRALTDADRQGWLDTIGAAVAVAVAKGEPVIAACSALKRRYRDRLRDWQDGIVFVYLDIDRAAAYARVAERRHHFMPPSLVDSQFTDLEPPEADEHRIVLDATLPVETLVEEALGRLTAPHGPDP